MLSSRVSTPCAQRAFTAAAVQPCRIAAARRSLVIVAIKPTTGADFRAMADEDLIMKVVELKQDLARCRFIRKTRGITELKAGSEQQPDPANMPKSDISPHTRRQVAQIKTIIRERQIAEGMGRKAARALNKKMRVEAGASLS
ncbi:MAG: hypothetical protein WDW38_010632 [Sanguina aurantia]